MGSADKASQALSRRAFAWSKETEFRLWIPSRAEQPLPQCIEYQAKSYLRLVFEAPAA